MAITLSNLFPITGLGNPTQTLTNVTGSRTSGVTYTNSTGSPIFVSISSTVSAVNGNLIVSIGSLSYNSCTIYLQNYTAQTSFIVPKGSTYSLSGNVASITSWFELR